MIRITAFTRKRKWSLDEHVKFQIFRERTTTRHDINVFCLNSPNGEYERVTRGNYSRKRKYINPSFFKEVNREYLKQMKYEGDMHFNRTFNGFRLFAVDGLTLSFDNSQDL